MVTDDFKETNLEWIGNIPQDWKLTSFKNVLDFTVGFTPSTSVAAYYDSDDFAWATIADLNQKYVSETKNKLSNLGAASSAKAPVKKGSLLYSFKLSVGKVAFADIELYTNEAILAIEPKDDRCLSYLYYMLPLILEYNANYNMYGAKIFNQEVIINSKIPYPPLKRQQEIADFLDQKTAQIDTIIEKKQKLLQLIDEKKKSLINEAVTKGLNPNVPMKDSGIEWIGSVPCHWQSTKFKYIGECKGRIGFRGYSVDDLVTEDTIERCIVLGGTNIMRDGTISYDKLTYLSIEKYYESPEIMLEGGEILITKVGAGVGENAIYKNINEKVTINPNVMLFKPFNRNMSDFLNYYLFSESIKSHTLMESRKSGAQPAINQSFLNDLQIFLPPIEEQIIISEFIKGKLIESKFISTQITDQIAKLKEYRQSIISEAVTGKLKIEKLWQKE